MQKEKSLSRNKDVNKRGVIYEKPSGACLTAGGLRPMVLIVNEGACSLKRAYKFHLCT